MKTQVNVVELATNLAEKDLRKKMKKNEIFIENSENELVYTELAQKLFDEYYDYYYEKIINK